jgi:hypothetical protein
MVWLFVFEKPLFIESFKKEDFMTVNDKRNAKELQFEN